MKGKLDKILEKSNRLEIDSSSKIIIMSDCHRGSGDSYDNFIRNQCIYDAALKYYYKNDYTYIELGDGDDMWEVDNYKDIVNEHIDSFELIKKFHDDNRLIMIYGNHDIVKKSKSILKDFIYNDKDGNNLLNDLDVYESIILSYYDKEILLIHGHQVDLLNGKFWRLSRFLVRHLWRHFERFGLNDPTKAAKNYKVSKRLERKFEKWSIKNNIMLIAGHTHRPILPEVGKSLYFNDGSCIHPNGITCLEIDYGKISLIKWVLELKDDEKIGVGRKVIESGEEIEKFFLKDDIIVNKSEV